MRYGTLFRRHDGRRIGGGLMRCGSLVSRGAARNGLGSIPLFCVTRSVDRLTDKGHVEDLMPGRGRAGLSLPEGRRSYGARIASRGEGRWSRRDDLVDGARVRNFEMR